MKHSGYYIPDPEGLQQRIREQRERLDMTQAELSFPGCTSVYISRIERGERVPSLQVIHGLADRLGVGVSWLLTGKQPPNLIRLALMVVREYEDGVEPPEELIAALKKAAHAHDDPFNDPNQSEQDDLQEK